MKKKICSLLAGTLLVTALSVPAFAATRCFCGGKMEKTVHQTPWITSEYVDCSHQDFHTKDAVQECTEVTSYVCQRCGQGFHTEITRKNIKCLEPKAQDEIATDGATCSACWTNGLSTKTHRTPWLTVETDKDGNSRQKRTVVKTFVCENCGNGTITEETEARIIRLHG